MKETDLSSSGLQYLKNPNICQWAMRMLCTLINEVFLSSAGILCQEECHICLSRTVKQTFSVCFRAYSSEYNKTPVSYWSDLDHRWFLELWLRKQHFLDIPGRLTCWKNLWQLWWVIHNESHVFLWYNIFRFYGNATVVRSKCNVTLYRSVLFDRVIFLCDW